MTWKGFFEGIQAFFESFAFAPYNALRALEPSNWWTANIVSWIFVVIVIIALVYWIGQLKKYEIADDEDNSVTAHEYLG